MHVSNVFAITKAKGFQLTLIEYLFNYVICSGVKKFPHSLCNCSQPCRAGCNFGQRLAMSVSYSQKTIEVLLSFRASLHGEEVDDLDEEPGVALARISDGFNQFAESWNEPVMTNSKQGTTGNVANSGRFNDQNP